MSGNKLQKICYWVVTSGYVGHLPTMPGTWASLLAAGTLFLLPELSLITYLGIVLAIFTIGMLSIAQVLRQTQEHDPSWIVIDEWWGMSIALIGVPKSFHAYVVALILFRIFDISKVALINRLQRLPGNWGIMFDDGLAGIFALVGTHIFFLLKTALFF